MINSTSLILRVTLSFSTTNSFVTDIALWVSFPSNVAVTTYVFPIALSIVSFSTSSIVIVTLVFLTPLTLTSSVKLTFSPMLIASLRISIVEAVLSVTLNVVDLGSAALKYSLPS